MIPIKIVPLVPVAEEIVSMLAAPLAQVFRTTVEMESPLRGVIDTVYDYSRAQYNSTLLIGELLSRNTESSSKIRGIVDRR